MNQDKIDTRTVAFPGVSHPGFFRRVPGVAAAAWVLATSRWGSYIGVGNLFYVTDLLLLLGLFGYTSHYFRHRARGERRALRSFLLAVFLSYVLIRTLTSGYPLPLALRDSVPYLYVVLIPTVGYAFQHASPSARARVGRLLLAALFLHLVFVVIRVAAPDAIAQLPIVPGSPGVRYLSPRGDVDDAVLAVLAGFYSFKATSGRGSLLLACTVMLTTISLVTLQGSRAGLLCLLASLAIGTARGLRSLQSRRLVWAGLSLTPILLPILVSGLALTGAGSRLLPSLHLGDPRTAVAIQATGTLNARQQVWRGAIQYTNAVPARAVFGVGFGADFLDAAGVLPLLAGTTYADVRSPHDIFVGLDARLGVLGILLYLGIIIAFVLPVLRRKASTPETTDDAGTLGWLLFAALGIAALFGVVFESPFGAVPAYVGLGVAFGEARWLSDRR